jgi:putative hydrolase of HD superfamily
MEDREQRRKLNAWVAEQFRPDLESLPGDLSGRFERYLLSETSSREQRILRAAHYLATKWEFDFVYEWSRKMYRIEETRKEIYSQVEDLGRHPLCPEMLTAWDAPDDRKAFSVSVSLVGQLGFPEALGADAAQFRRRPFSGICCSCDSFVLRRARDKRVPETRV